MKKKNFATYFLATFFCFNLKANPGASKKVEAINIVVSDLNRAVDFYTKVLNYEKVNENEQWGETVENLEGTFGIHYRRAKLKLGDECILLTDYLTSGGRPVPVDSKSNDLWFQHIAIVVSDMDSAYKHLMKFNVEHVSTLPQTIPVLNKAAAGVRAFYFHDPDNHTLELISFPPDKGDKRWQNKNALFLGIDHTAIGVSSTEKSLKFYAQFLGLERKGESFNYGTEQEHLNNVQGASLHITGLRAASGPGVEFLEYLKPGPAKKYPSDARQDDLISWQTEIEVNDLQSVIKNIPKAGGTIVSSGIIEMDRTKVALVRDPDGHLILLVQNLSENTGTN